MMGKVRIRVVVGCGFVSAALACGEGQPEGGVTASLVEVGRVVFEESSDDPIAAISFLSRRPGGGFLVVDAPGNEVILFDSNGRLERAMGRAGDGPGELDAPTAGVELPDGRVMVTQRGSPRMTVFWPDGDPESFTVPGVYGWWVDDLGGRLALGIGSRGDRFVLTSYEGDSLASFGAVQEEVNQVPFWIYYARENATAWAGQVAINTSFYPTVRIFSREGALVDSIGEAPESWVQASEPPVDRARGPDAQEAVKEWSRGFSMVAAVAGLESGHLVVQYGRFSPTEQDTYHVEPTSIDIYDPMGAKVASGLDVRGRVLAGGDELLVLVGEPPEPWTVARLIWAEDAGR